MQRIIHCADLHLSEAEKEYSFSVLQNIVDTGKKREADLLLFSGDVFDSFEDMERLKSTFISALKPIVDDCKIFIIAGNHEELRAGRKRIEGLNFSPLQLVTDRPFLLKSFTDVEIVFVPYQESYKDYMRWEIPAKQLPYRIAVAHTSVPGLHYLGPEEETAAAVLDRDFFSRFQVDYAALGHIHKPLLEAVGNCIVSYPGSARVWRKGEAGPRLIRYISTGDKLRVEDIALEEAGVYRPYHLKVGLDGSLPDIEEAASEWKRQDYIDISVEGLVEDEHLLSGNIASLKKKYLDRVRKLEVVHDVAVLAGIMEEEIARRFIEEWHKMEEVYSDSEDRTVWLKARQIGLAKIKAVLEARA